MAINQMLYNILNFIETLHRIPLSPLNTKISRKSHKSNICETFLLPFDLSYIFLQVEIIRI